MMGRNFTKEFTTIKDRVHKRLEGWNNHLLSKAWNAVLIKAVVQAIPTYTMTTFKLPSRVCKDLDRAPKRFWWASNSNSGIYLALKAWDDICKHKNQRGLGFRRFNDYNLALLSKLAWKLGSGKDFLWSRVMRAKYLKEQTFFEHKVPRGALRVWRSIMDSSSLILKGSCFKLGDGFSVQP